MIKHPRHIFLFDGLGAVLSAFMTGLFLVNWEAILGIPSKVLYVLAAIPCLLAIYDFFSFHFGNNHYTKLLKGIAILNLGYCILSLYLAFTHKDEISYLGWIYIIIEIIIITTIAFYEFQYSKRIA